MTNSDYNEDQRVADLIIDNYIQVVLLEHFGIPLVVQGKTVKEICTAHHINPQLFLAFVSLFNGTIPSTVELSETDIPNILLYLQNCHRYYLEDKIPKIKEYVQRIANNNNTSGIRLLKEFTDGYIEEVSEHFAYENDIVFPYMEALSQNKPQDSDYSVTVYKQHHTNIDDKLADLKELLIKYLPFNDNEHLRRKMLACLFELEYDLKIHSHIEDSILIPLVEKLEHTDPIPATEKKDNVLSSREIDVLKCLIDGLSNKETADKLFISTHTVISHRKNISEKTGIKSLAGLTIYAIVHGIISITA